MSLTKKLWIPAIGLAVLVAAFGLLKQSLVSPIPIPAGASLPTGLLNAIVARGEADEVLFSKQCEIGKSEIMAYALILRAASGSADTFPLFPLIAFPHNGTWRLERLGLEVSYLRGAKANFLEDFLVNDRELAETFNVKCVIPNADADISEAANGLPTEAFPDPIHSGEHLCFAADSVYNSWVCYNLNGANDQIGNSFNQLNAD